jgi:hypothetical protein
MNYAISADYRSIISTRTGRLVADAPVFRLDRWVTTTDPVHAIEMLEFNARGPLEWRAEKPGTFTATVGGYVVKVVRHGANWTAYRDGALLVERRSSRAWKWGGLREAQHEAALFAELPRANWFSPVTRDDIIDGVRWRGAAADHQGDPPRIWWAHLNPETGLAESYSCNWPLTNEEEDAIFARADLFAWRHRIGTSLAQFALTPNEDNARALRDMQRAAREANQPFSVEVLRDVGAMRLGHAVASSETIDLKREFSIYDDFDAPATALEPTPDNLTHAEQAVRDYIFIAEKIDG